MSRLGPLLRGTKFLFPLMGRLLTTYVVGKRSLIGILGGLIDRVQSCSAGKNGMLLTGFDSFMILHRLMNSGQALSQLGCVESAQDTQNTLSLALHVLRPKSLKVRLAQNDMEWRRVFYPSIVEGDTDC